MNRQINLLCIACVSTLSLVAPAFANDITEHTVQKSLPDIQSAAIATTGGKGAQYEFPFSDEDTAPARAHTDVPDLPRSGDAGSDPVIPGSPNSTEDGFELERYKYKWSVHMSDSQHSFSNVPVSTGPLESMIICGEHDWLTPKLYRGDGTGFIQTESPRFDGDLLVLEESPVQTHSSGLQGMAFAIPTPATSLAILLGLTAASRRRR